ncbi:MAG TPA: FmdB family zinc ribbon protein [Candidatus Limnocylindrales bacterium]|jgi:putative FmdB family regulatory protein
MPIYDYACTTCGRVVEVVHGVDGSGPERCATCGGAMKKLIVSPAVHFKGSGWAKQDRRTSSTKAAAKAAAGGEGSAATTSESSKSDREPSKSEGGPAKNEAGPATPDAPAAATSGTTDAA